MVAMFSRRHGCVVVLSSLLSALSGAGCGEGGVMQSTDGKTLTREAKLDGMTCSLKLKSEKGTELSWSVTDRVIATFGAHRVEVEKQQVTLDNKTKKLPKGVGSVTIESENNVVTIQADGKPLFDASTK
jgi:hypothetical protein